MKAQKFPANLSSLLFISLFSFMLLISSCSVEHDAVKSFSGKPKTDLTMKEFRDKTGIKDFEITKKFSMASTTGRDISEFMIDTTLIKMYTNENNFSRFSFKIYPLDEILEPHTYYNLVYEKLNTDEWNQVVFKIAEKLNITEHQTRIDSVEMIYNEYPNVALTDLCATSEWVVQCDGSCGEDGCDGFECPTGQCLQEVLHYFFCGGSPIAGDTYANYLYISAGPSLSGGGGGGAGTFAPNPGIVPCDGSILCSNSYKFMMFRTNVLSQGQRDFLDGNAVIKADITAYLSENQFSQNSKDFAIELINQMMVNPNLFLDSSASAKSPTNVDLSLVKPDLSNPWETNHEQKKKFMCVFEKLMQSSKFRDILINIFADDSRLNLKFDIANLPGGPTGGRVGETEILNGNPMTSKITIDSDLLTSGSTLEIAKTIIHEMIHAFLNAKLCDPQIGITIPVVDNMEVFECINQYYGNFSGDQDQHDFIYNFMVPTMIDLMTDVKDLFITPAQNADIEGLILHISQNTTPPSVIDTPWNWSEYFKNASLNGLQNCSTFMSEIGTFTPGIAVPTTVINQQAMSYFMQYRNLAFTYFPHSCN